jgi:hypothetical protein
MQRLLTETKKASAERRHIELSRIGTKPAIS